MKNKIVASLLIVGLSMQGMLATILPGAPTKDQIIGKLPDPIITVKKMKRLISDYQQTCEKNKSTSCDSIEAFQCFLTRYLQGLNQNSQHRTNHPKKEA